MKLENITFITGNQAKVAQVANILGINLKHQKIDLDEIQSLDLEKIVKDKAKRAFDVIQSPVLVEDVSLKYTALGNLPGPLIRWFLEELGTKGLCRLINHYNKDRSAIAEVNFCLYDGKDFQVFNGSVRGKVAAYPRGETNFGWNPVFIPEGSSQTWAEMKGIDEGSSSMRKIALDKLRDFLKA